MSAPRRFAAVLALLILFTLALALDVPVANWVYQSGLSGWMKNSPDWFRWILRFPGRFWSTATAVIVLAIINIAKKRELPGRDSMLVLLAAIYSGVNAVFKWGFGRGRPFHGTGPWELQPFKGGWHGSWLAEQNLSFPSGDASLAFAMAMAMSLVRPRGWPIWWIAAIIVSLERIAEGAHYPSDVTAGAALGIVCALAAQWTVTSCESAHNPQQQRTV